MPWLLVMSRIMSAHAGGGATAGGGLGSTVAWPAGGEGGLMPAGAGVARSKPRTPGTAEERQGQETPTISSIARLGRVWL